VANGIRSFSAGPLAVLAIVLLIALVLVLIPLLVLGVIGTAFTRLGLSWVAALALVLLILGGSSVNIPLYRIQRDVIRATRLDSGGNEHSGAFAARPVWETVISINLGGGCIPLCIAAYMVYQGVMVTGTTILLPIAACAALILIISFLSTREVTGVGIRVPVIVPAVTALHAGILLSGGTGLTAAVTALAGGTIGTLAGGNLAHLRRVRDLAVPEVSIGGSGTFASVSLCCILPALIA
jgi:uncharacterized membrane protein